MKLFPFYIFIVLAFLLLALFAVLSQSSNQSSVIALPPPLPLLVDTAEAPILETSLEGPKKALLIGINYTNTNYELQGCQEDVQNLSEFLQQKGFTVETCTDADEIKPTLEVLQAKIAAFLLSLGPQETGVLWYSGHGLLLQDGENAWVPVDFLQSGFLDESWVIAYLKTLPATTRLFIGSDACHSGSTFNLKYDVEPELSKLMQTSSYKQVMKTKAVTTSFKDLPLPTTFYGTSDKKYELFDTLNNLSEMDANIVVLSASRDDQISTEANENGEIQGAMTYAFLTNASLSTSLGNLQDLMRNTLFNVPQTPQLSFSRLFHPLSTLQAFGL